MKFELKVHFRASRPIVAARDRSMRQSHAAEAIIEYENVWRSLHHSLHVYVTHLGNGGKHFQLVMHQLRTSQSHAAAISRNTGK